MTTTDHNYRNLQTAEEVDRYITDEHIDHAVDWFDSERSMPTDELMDRLFPRHSSLKDEAGREIDCDSLDNEAARRIMARARKNRKERQL